jgi:hypothetical protein
LFFVHLFSSGFIGYFHIIYIKPYKSSFLLVSTKIKTPIYSDLLNKC